MRERFDKLVSALFELMDKDDGHKVNITEFIKKYLDEYTRLKEEIEDLEL